MRGSSFGYLVKQGTKNIWINKLMSLASVGILATSLLMVGFAMLFTININSIVQYVMEQNEALVIIKDEATPDQIATLKTELENNSNIFEVIFVPKEEAYEKQKEQAGGNREIFESFDGSYLPDGYNVRITDLNRQKETIAELRQLDNVLRVRTSIEFGEFLTQLKNIVNIAGFAIVLALIIISIVIISNTIRASVFSRRREINIMKYVGATDGFIRFPFIVEGLLIGLLSAAVSFGLLWGGYAALTKFIISDASTVMSGLTAHLVPFDSVALVISVSFAVAGMLAGIIGSVTSIRSHLKV